MTPTTLGVILSMLQQARAEDGHFLYRPCRSAIGARSRTLPEKHHPWWRLAMDKAVVRQPVNVLTRCGRPQWGSRGVWLIRPRGLEGSEDTASQAVAWPRRRSRPFLSASSSRLDPQSDARQECAARVSSESKRPIARNICLIGRVISFGRGTGEVELAEA
jgi:hypothetical protein